MHKMFVLLAVVYCGCQSEQARSAKNGLPGTYVRSFAHEFAKGTDTLYVRTSDDMHYLIDRGSAFERIQGVRVLPVEYVTEHWSGLFDEQKGAVIENRTGKVIRLDPGDGKLYVGASGYEKVK